MEEGMANWSELPQELLAEIATRLKRPEEVSRFRAVCQKCRTLVPPPNLKLLPSIFPPKVAVFLIEPLAYPSKRWISTAEVGKLRVLYPFSRRPAPTLPNFFPKPLDLRYFNVTLLSESCNFWALIEDQEKYTNTKLSQISLTTCRTWISTAYKVLVYPNPDYVNLSLNDCTNIDLDLVVLLKGGVLLTFNVRRLELSFAFENFMNYYDDIILFRRMVCTLDQTGRLYAIDKGANIVTVVVDVPICGDNEDGTRKRLVESFGELYLVVRMGVGRGIVRFRVYKLNEVESRWDEVYNLGGCTLFVGFDSCFFVSTLDLPGCEPNCIVSRKNCFLRSPGFPFLEDDFFKGAHEVIEIGAFQFGFMSSHIHISYLLWPPPKWFWLESYSKSRNPYEELEMKPDQCSKNVPVKDQEQTVANACIVNATLSNRSCKDAGNVMSRLS